MMQRGCLLFILSFLVSSFTFGQWTNTLPTVGTFSSVRVSDLNNDGTKDIVLGAGRQEFQSCDTAVVALDGTDGRVLWTVSASDQIFGSAIFYDITGDGIDDVFIGGRSAELIAIDGSNGEVVWRFSDMHPADSINHRWFNFYNPQLIGDHNGDGYRDMLISNGGDVMVEAHDDNRPAGYLLIIDTRTGGIISEAEMPDGREIYMSPVVIPNDDSGNVIYGTGGETVGGALYMNSIQEIISGKLSIDNEIHRSKSKGYIGPPVLADLNQDDGLDIITNAVDGIIIATDGKTLKSIWEVKIPHTESYSSACVGQFTDDDVLDVFVSLGQGVWPKLDWSIQKMINGKTGEVEFTDSLGFYQNTSPLAVDLNNDGRDEIIMSLNIQETDTLYQKYFYTTLIAIEFESGDVVQLTDMHPGSNLSSTPWIGDLDGDGFLDILYCHGTSLRHTYTFDGININRLVTQIPIPQNPFWGAYQGNDYDGIFKSGLKR